MDTVLWCLDDFGTLPYDNCFTMSGARRGGCYVYRGGWASEPSQSPDTSYFKLPEVGGIIGYDQPHGPEGMVYGTVPYQKRDFLRVYIEWREQVRRGEPRAIRPFNWMTHPYELLPGAVGTDGRPPRVHIRELVSWLAANFIERPDESGFVVARFANAGVIRATYENWAAAEPAAAVALQATLAAGERPLYLPALHDRLDTAHYADVVPSPNPDLAGHRFTDRLTGTSVYLFWSRSGSQPLEPTLTGTYRVLHGDGSTEELPSSDISIGEEPVILEAIPSSDVPSGEGAAAAAHMVRLLPIEPNPVRQGPAVIAFTLARQARTRLTLHDISGRLVATLVSGPRAAGGYRAELDAAALSPGVYIVRLEAAAEGVGGKTVSRKLLVAR